MYNTVSGKKIAFYGWAFKKDTNDTRESAAIYVAKILLEEQAQVIVYDPQVRKAQVVADLEYVGVDPETIAKLVTVVEDPYEAAEKAHAIAVLTEWDEFKGYDWARIKEGMMRPAYVFDGRKLLNRKEMEEKGFMYYAIGE
jgi:UDPglucose 6-dehydrogenase